MNLEHAETCIPNISSKERRKRLLSGVVMFIISLAVWSVLAGSGANPWWRLGLFPLFMGAATGYFQWRDKT